MRKLNFFLVVLWLLFSLWRFFLGVGCVAWWWSTCVQQKQTNLALFVWTGSPLFRLSREKGLKFPLLGAKVRGNETTTLRHLKLFSFTVALQGPSVPLSLALFKSLYCHCGRSWLQQHFILSPHGTSGLWELRMNITSF